MTLACSSNRSWAVQVGHFPRPLSRTDSDTDKIKYLTLTDVRKVWQPDTFFRNEKIGKFHDILAPNLYVRIHPNGDVLYSIRFVCVCVSINMTSVLLVRVSLTASCYMRLKLFPFDQQTCHLYLASCGLIRT